MRRMDVGSLRERIEMTPQRPPSTGSTESEAWPSAPTFGTSGASRVSHGRPPPGGRYLQRPVDRPAKSFPVAWLLSLILGLYGADRFYLGRWKSGLVKLLTFGGFFIWYLVDLILLTLGQLNDSSGRRIRPTAPFVWPSRIVSGAVVAGFLGVFALSATAEDAAPPAPDVAAVEQSSLEDAAQEAPQPAAGPADVPTTELASTPEVETPAEGTALAVLAGLEQKDRGEKAGYDRDTFGWREDLDRNGCDTRNDVLRRDLHTITLKAGTQGCVVLRGILESPYSGDTVDFDRANSTIDIDHVVSLSDAWQTGASTWDEQRRHEFANDPLNLLAVESSLNRQKGDGDAATWLPPKKDYRCEYVSRQVAVKDKYDLWVKPAEAEAIERVLSDCEGFLAITGENPWPVTGDGDVVATESEPTKEPAPTQEAEPAPTKAPEPVPAPAPAPAKDPVPATKDPAPVKKDPAPAPAPAPAPVKKDPPPAPKQDDSSGSAYYKNCDAVRAAGAAPIHRGDPGYAKHLDRDGDGVGCE